VKRQTIVWTALPKSSSATSVRLSVLVSPRLQSDQPPPQGADHAVLRLDEFADFLDWPATLAQIGFSVRFDDGPPLPARVLPPPQSPAPSALWKSLFNAGTDVIPHEFDDLTGAIIHSPPHKALDEIIKQTYVAVLTEPGLGQGVHKPPHDALAKQPPFSDIAPGAPGTEGTGGTVVVTDPPGTTTPPGDPPAPGDTRGLEVSVSGGVVVGDISVGIDGELHLGLGGLLGGGGGTQPGGGGGGGGTQPGGGGGGGTQPGGGGGTQPGGGSTTKTPGPVIGQEKKFLAPPATEPPSPPDEAELRHLFDFHEAVSLLNDHPNLARRLGLVVELEVLLPGGGLLGGLFSPSSVQVLPTWSPVLEPTTNVAPFTACTRTPDRFSATPRPKNAEVGNGLLRLDDPAWAVLLYDVDGAAEKLSALANTLVNRPVTATTPPAEGLPALRSGGISLVRDDRAAVLAIAIDRARQFNDELQAVEKSGVRTGPEAPGAAGPQFAEDLISGYRVDVFDEVTERWHSLCRRRTTYTLLHGPGGSGPGASFTIEDEEAAVQPAITEKVKPPRPPIVIPGKGRPATGRELFTGPAEFTWEGWSLCAPRPGNHITGPDDTQGPQGPQPAETAQPVVNEARTSIPLLINSKAVPRTLPRLRYGRSYRVRARAVDVAGNSLRLFQVPADSVPHVTREVDYLRYDPVASPPLVLVDLPIEGESAERLVVRPDTGHDRCERHVAPPKTSQRQVELHGRFDGMTPPDSHALATREEGSFDPRPGPLPADVTIIDTPAAPRGGGYVLHGEDKLALPYLPDPLARGALFVGLPGGDEVRLPTGEVVRMTRVSFGGAWPDLAPFRLRVVPASAAASRPRLVPATTKDEAVLEVPLPAAETVTVALSTFMTGSDPAQAELLDVMGVWRWVKDLGGDSVDVLEELTLLGLNWMLMPSRELVLVHPVQRPLPPLQITSAVADKPPRPDGTPALGSTFGLVHATAAVHGKSTDKVELLAHWVDPLDDPSDPSNNPMDAFVDGRANLGHRDVRRDDDVVSFDNGIQQHFGDTRHHLVKYRALATSRFREYFPPPKPSEPPLDFTRLSEPDAPPIDPAADRQGRPMYELRHQALTGIEASVPSSARPAPPTVAYVLPTFAWSRSADGRSSTRKGKGLRVYLERPWFSSGVGEQLGVVFAEGRVEEPLAKFVTAWGADPIWKSTPPVEQLTAANFPGAAVAAGVALEDLPGSSASVAPFDVRYDHARGLWFADVEIDLGDSYFPFVRLAVARYQRNSLQGVELSKIVVTEFVQLAPDRAASVSEEFASKDPNNTSKERGFVLRGPDASHFVAYSQPGPAPGDVDQAEEIVHTRVEADVLKRTGPGELDWELDQDASTLVTERRIEGPELVVHGLLAYPGDGASRRLVLKEIESFELRRTPEVHSIEPSDRQPHETLARSDIEQGASREVIVKGRWFRSDAVVSFGPPGGVFATEIRFVDPTTLRVQVEVGLLARVGARDVFVHVDMRRNPKVGRLVNHFSVKPMSEPVIRSITWGDPGEANRALPILVREVSSSTGDAATRSMGPADMTLKLSGERLFASSEVTFTAVSAGLTETIVIRGDKRLNQDGSLDIDITIPRVQTSPNGTAPPFEHGVDVAHPDNFVQQGASATRAEGAISIERKV
jgi:hypothetical protein